MDARAVLLRGGSKVSHCQCGLASLGLLICLCASVCPHCVAPAVGRQCSAAKVNVKMLSSTASAPTYCSCVVWLNGLLSVWARTIEFLPLSGGLLPLAALVHIDISCSVLCHSCFERILCHRLLVTPFWKGGHVNAAVFLFFFSSSMRTYSWPSMSYHNTTNRLYSEGFCCPFFLSSPSFFT